jgi:hypothetical protein
MGGIRRRFVLLMISHSFEDLRCDTHRSEIDLSSVGEGVLLVLWLGLDSVFSYDTYPTKKGQWDWEVSSRRGALRD